MERIEEAIRKAKTSGGPEAARPSRKKENRAPSFMGASSFSGLTAWNPPQVSLDPVHLERNKIVMHNMTDPSHVAFKILRTRLYQMMTENNWTNVAITSPAAGCGKTMVSINLALGMARQTDCTTVLIDLDLKKTSVSRTLGIKGRKSIGQYLNGDCDLEECFVAVKDNLFVGLNHAPIKNFSEIAEDDCVRSIIPQVMEGLRPKVIIIDLPPALSGDEVTAYLPCVESSILIAAAGETTVREIAECELQLSAASNFLGVVLNKSVEEPVEVYQYEEA